MRNVAVKCCREQQSEQRWFNGYESNNCKRRERDQLKPLRSDKSIGKYINKVTLQ